MKVVLFLVLVFAGQQGKPQPLMEDMPSLEECLLSVHDALYDEEVNARLRERGGMMQASCVVTVEKEPKA